MKVLKWLDQNIELLLMGIVLIVMTLVICADILLRTVTGSGVIWAQELSRYCTIFIAEMGISYGLFSNKHIRVDIVEQFFPKTKKPLHLLSDIVAVIFCALIAYHGIGKIQSAASMGLKSPTMQMPSAWLYSVTEVGLAFGVIRCIERNVKGFMSAKEGGEAKA